MLRRLKNHPSNRLRIAKVSIARARGPYDVMSQTVAPNVNDFMLILLFPILLISAVITPVSTFLFGLLFSITFGLAAFVFSVILWWPILIVLVGTSWIWIHVPLSRPLLLLPGSVFSRVAEMVTGLMPDMGDWNARAAKGAICESWPLSLNVFRGPDLEEYGRLTDSWKADLANPSGNIPRYLRKLKAINSYGSALEEYTRALEEIEQLRPNRIA